MGPSHAVAVGGGAGGGAALLAILTGTWHMDPALASSWIVLGSIVLAPIVAALMAWAGVKTKTDPALAAAIAALTEAVQQQQPINPQPPAQVTQP